MHTEQGVCPDEDTLEYEETIATLQATNAKLLEALETKLCQCDFTPIVGTTTKRGTDYCYLHNEDFRATVDSIQTKGAAWLKQAFEAIREAKGGVSHA